MYVSLIPWEGEGEEVCVCVSATVFLDYAKAYEQILYGDSLLGPFKDNLQR